MGAITKIDGKKGVAYRALIRKKNMSPISKTFRKKSEAQDWICKTETDISRDHYREDHSFFGDVVDEYILKIGNIKPIGRSKLCALKAIRLELGSYKLKDLTTKTLQEYATMRALTCKPSTVQQDLSYIGTVLRVSEAMFLVKPKLKDLKNAQNNLTLLGVIANSDERDRRVTDLEIDSVIYKLSSELPVEAWIKFALATAMRLGEIASLRWCDMSADGKSIVIRQRKHPRKKRDQLVPLLPAARDLIAKQSRPDLPGKSLIFPQNKKSITTAYRLAVNRAGIEDLTFHDLRHEAISRLFECGFDSMVVAVFSGHRDINMLRRYTHINANKVLEILELKSSKVG